MLTLMQRTDTNTLFYVFRFIFEPDSRTKNLPFDNLGVTSANAEGAWLFVGGVAGDIVIGIHLRLLGERLCAGL